MLEYDNIGEYGRLCDICEQGIAILKQDTSEAAANFRGIFIAERLRIERLKDRTDTEEALYRRYRDNESVGIAADAYLDMEGARIYYILGDYEKSRRLCSSYLKKWRKWKNHVAELGDGSMFFLSAAFEPNIHGVVTELLQKIKDTDAHTKSKKGTHRMKKSRPQLTISLLSSGRSQTIERCLKSLSPLKENLDTEIIIVDTDPTRDASVRAILERHADQIIPFAWCDDFAAARNAGLFAASGEWFLYIDDDEWFMDAQPIIDFLSSSEKKSYEWANFTTRNYTNPERSQFTDAWATRLAHRTKRLRFKGRIHEYFDPLPGRPKVLSAVAGHTGYIYRTKEDREAHNRRNIGLLKQMIKDEPDEPRWWLQLLQEYDDSGDVEKQREICIHCLSMIRDKSGNGYNRSRGLFAADTIRIERGIKDWEAARQAYENAMKDSRYHDVAKAYMELDAAQLYFRLKEYEECEKHCREYLTHFDRWHERLDEVNEDLMFFMSETFEPHMWGLAVCLLMYVETKDGRWEAFDRYFDEAEWSDEMLYDFRGYEDKLLEVVEESEYNRRFAHMLGTFWANQTARDVVEAHLGKLKTEKGDSYWRLVQAILKAEPSEHKPYDLRILWADHTDEEADFAEMYRQMFDHVTPLLLDVSLWEIGLRHQVPFGQMIVDQPFGKWRRAVDYFTEKAPKAMKPQMLDIFDRITDRDSEQRNYFVFRVLARMMAESEKQKPYQELERELARFAECCLRYYRLFCSDEALGRDSVLLADDCRLALRIQIIMRHVETGDYRQVLSEIRNAVGIYPALDDTLQAYSHLYGENIKRHSSPQAEMQQLMDDLYAKVDELAAAGLLDEARGIIAQIEQLVPPDMKQ